MICSHKSMDCMRIRRSSMGCQWKARQGGPLHQLLVVSGAATISFGRRHIKGPLRKGEGSVTHMRIICEIIAIDAASIPSASATASFILLPLLLLVMTLLVVAPLVVATTGLGLAGCPGGNAHCAACWAVLQQHMQHMLTYMPAQTMLNHPIDYR
jgi:hypothetical protein